MQRRNPKTDPPPPHPHTVGDAHPGVPSTVSRNPHTVGNAHPGVPSNYCVAPHFIPKNKPTNTPVKTKQQPKITPKYHRVDANMHKRSI